MVDVKNTTKALLMESTICPKPTDGRYADSTVRKVFVKSFVAVCRFVAALAQ